LSGISSSYGTSEERIEWVSPPISVQIMNPYLLSLLTDSSVEIHELATLSSIQRIQISSPSPHNLSLAICCEDYQKFIGGQPSNFLYHAYLCNGEQLSVLRMVPLANQVNSLKIQFTSLLYSLFPLMN
jgi:hypothetical protein